MRPCVTGAALDAENEEGKLPRDMTKLPKVLQALVPKVVGTSKDEM
jgi:hypothetical protein